MITLYGIKNCDSVKKARKWLDANHIDYQFHDLREDGLSDKQVTAWVKELGWETVVNKRSTTWKQLDEATRHNMDQASAIKTLVAHPTLIKRPLLDTGNEHTVGFKEADYKNLLKHHTL